MRFVPLVNAGPRDDAPLPGDHRPCMPPHSALGFACCRKVVPFCIFRRRAMRRCIGSLLLTVLISFSFLITKASAQVDHIVLAAGTDEDHALQEISSQQDATKKLTMYQDFVQKFSANPQAVAYGDWQLAQAYQASGELQKSLDFGDKGLAGS